MKTIILSLLLLSLSFSQVDSSKKNKQLPKQKAALNDISQTWKDEHNKIKDPDLQKKLEQLRFEFENKRKEIQKSFKLRMEDLKKQRDSQIDGLKNEFTVKRDELRSNYSQNKKKKPKKIRGDRKPSNVNDNTPPLYKNKKPVPMKSTPIVPVDKKKKDPKEKDKKSKEKPSKK